MEVKVTISADESALEFSRNLSILGTAISKHDDPEGAKMKKMADEFWGTIEPDPMPETEVKGEPDQKPAPKEAEKPKYTAIEIRKAGADYMERKGAKAFKELLAKYNAPKLTELGEEHYEAFMEDINNG